MLDKEYALVLTLHRDDLVAAGLSEKLRDTIDWNTLEEIANKLSDALLDNGYWDCLSTIINDMGLENQEDQDDRSK